MAKSIAQRTPFKIFNNIHSIWLISCPEAQIPKGCKIDPSPIRKMPLMLNE